MWSLSGGGDNTLMYARNVRVPVVVASPGHDTSTVLQELMHRLAVSRDVSTGPLGSSATLSTLTGPEYVRDLTTLLHAAVK